MTASCPFAAGLGAPAGLTADEVREILPEVVGDPPIVVQQVRDVTEEGDTVTAITELNAGGSLSNDRLTFVEVDGAWLIDLYESNAGPVEVPGGYEALDVDMFEYGYELTRAVSHPATASPSRARTSARNPMRSSSSRPKRIWTSKKR